MNTESCLYLLSNSQLEEAREILELPEPMTISVIDTKSGKLLNEVSVRADADFTSVYPESGKINPGRPANYSEGKGNGFDVVYRDGYSVALGDHDHDQRLTVQVYSDNVKFNQQKSSKWAKPYKEIMGDGIGARTKEFPVKIVMDVNDNRQVIIEVPEAKDLKEKVKMNLKAVTRVY